LVITRLFEATLLRDNHRGGKRDYRNVFARLDDWGKGFYREGYLRWVQPQAAKRKAKREEAPAGCGISNCVYAWTAKHL
jgi:hypothetical protein